MEPNAGDVTRKIGPLYFSMNSYDYHDFKPNIRCAYTSATQGSVPTYPNSKEKIICKSCNCFPSYKEFGECHVCRNILLESKEFKKGCVSTPQKDSLFCLENCMSLKTSACVLDSI